MLFIDLSHDATVSVRRPSVRVFVDNDHAIAALAAAAASRKTAGKTIHFSVCRTACTADTTTPRSSGASSASRKTVLNGIAGTPNTGGGGACCDASAAAGGAGGTGIVIVRYIY